MEGDVSPGTSDQTRSKISDVSNVSEINDTGTGMEKMSRLNEKIEKLVVELKFMHDENDNMRLRFGKHDAEMKQKDNIHDENIKKLREELDKARELISQKEDELSRVKSNDAEQYGCGCRQSETHNCDWVAMQEKIDSQDQAVNGMESDRSDLLARIKARDTACGELSKQLEALRENGEKDQLLLAKTESVINVKDELLSAKQEIIENLKFRINTYEKQISKSKEDSREDGNSDLTSNTRQGDEPNEISPAPNGVDDACEFIKVYAKNGVVISGFLLWANIQRLTRPESDWKEEAVASFLKNEITDAKECLWRICGDKIAIPLKKRQGPSKSMSEVDDMAKALNLLAEKECLPMFLATGDMVKETPISSHPEESSGNDKAVITSLKKMEDTLQSILESNGNSSEGSRSSVRDNDSVVRNKTVNAVTWADDADIDLGNDEGWTVQGPKKASSVKDNKTGNQQVDKKSGKQSWKDRLNILKGTATGGMNGIPQSADVHLVVYGLGKDTTGEQLTHWLYSNGLQVKNCILLTKYEGARSNTFKISIKASDYDKAVNPDIWPENVGLRKYKFFDQQKNMTVLGKSKKSNFSQPWKEMRGDLDLRQNAWKEKRGGLDARQNGFVNFNPPSDEQVRNFYRNTSARNIGSEQNGHIGNNMSGVNNYSGMAENSGNSNTLFGLPNANPQINAQFPNLSFRLADGRQGGSY